MKVLYFRICIPTVTGLPVSGDQYYTDDVNDTGNPITIRANSVAAVDIVTPFKREGFKVLSLTQNFGIDGYEPGSGSIQFDNFDGKWYTVVRGANLYGCAVHVYIRECNGEIYTDNRIAQLRIKNWSFGSYFVLELSDDSLARNANGMPLVTYDGDFTLPTMRPAWDNQYINIGFGNFSTLAIDAAKDGVAKGWKLDTGFRQTGSDTVVPMTFLCAFTPSESNLSITRVWVNGVLEDTPGVYDVVNVTGYFPTGQEARWVGVLWNTTEPAGVEEITFEMNYYTYTSSKMVSLLVDIMGGFGGMVYDSTKNEAFHQEMLRRGLDSSVSSSLRASYQEKMTPSDFLTEFCESVGLAKWRLNNKREVELLALVPGAITADITFGVADILEYNVKSNHDYIENVFNYRYGYLPQSGEQLYKNSFLSVNTLKSIDLYGKIETTKDKTMRWVYNVASARTVSVFRALEKCLPRIEVTAVVNGDLCTPSLLAGDIVYLKNENAVDQGADYRYYQVEHLERNFETGNITAEMVDITHYNEVDYARKFSLQPVVTGTQFYNESIAYYLTGSVYNAGSSNMTIKDDSTAISGYSWRTSSPSSSTSYLYWGSSISNFNNITGYTDYCISFRFKLTDKNTAQVFCCGSRVSAQNDYWRINFNTSLKRLGFVLYANDVAQITVVTANNSINDTNWHHLVFQKRGNVYELYLDGVIAGTATSSTVSTVQGYHYVGALYTATGGLTQHFTGYMEEYHVWHEANPWNANGSTCDSLTEAATWFGVNGAWPYYGTPA